MADDWHVDGELLERYRRGEPGVRETLFARHAAAVIGFFRGKVPPDDVEDLAHETLTRLFAGLGRVREGHKLRAYVNSIRRNVLLEYLRKQPRARPFDPEMDALDDVAPGVTSIVGARQEMRLLLAGLRRIPLDKQILLERHYIEGVSMVALAEEAGVSGSTMRGRMARARELLIRAITELEAEGALIQSTIDRLDDWAADVRALIQAPEGGQQTS